MAIDFYTYTLKIADGAEIPIAKEYLVMASSLKSHRHRKGEILAVMLDFNYPALITENEIKEMATDAGKTFFATPGSVTNAIQSAAGSINNAILEKNLAADSGETLNASASFAVSHNGYLFLAQAGIAYTFIIGAESLTHFTNPDPNERGLGASRRFYLNFKQITLSAGDLIILSTNIPATWDDEHLKGSHLLSMEQVRRRLMNQINGDLTALVIKCREGKGTVQEEDWAEKKSRFFPNRAPVLENEESLSSEKDRNAEVPPSEFEKPDDFSSQSEFTTIENPVPVDFEQQDYGSDEHGEDIVIETGQAERARTGKEKQPPEAPPQRIKKAKRHEGQLFNQSTGQPSKIKEEIRKFFLKIGSRLSANSSPLEGGGSTHLMSVIVIAIPIILIATAALVYIYSGRREQHQAFLAEAQSYISQAASIEEASQQREYWLKAYDTVLKALEFGDSDLSATLLTQTQTIIDDMDLVTRLDFRPATTSQFSQDVVLSKIKGNDSGIYLLDSAGGRIYHTEKNSKGFYEVDANFQCGPGTYGVITLGKIVDFTTLPTNTRAYEVLAVDSAGNLLYCLPDSDPVPGSLIPPESEWGRIAAMSLDEYTLYVVDADHDRIWSYSGRDFEIAAMAGIVFSSHPVDFLGTEEVELGGALDLIVNKEDMFILHEDSHMTTCQYNPYREGNATECQDPTAYGDSRIGYEKNPLVYFDSQFRVIQETTYPNSAFYILDAAKRAVLQYSYQLNLERMLKPQPSKTYPLPETEMTGVGVSTEKELFLAFGNQLYVGELP